MPLRCLLVCLVISYNFEVGFWKFARLLHLREEGAGRNDWVLSQQSVGVS